MYNITLFDGITQTLNTKGKRIVQANCVTQFFPEDGAFMQQLPVGNGLSVGAILEPDKDEPLRNVWLLIPVTSTFGSSAKPANFTTIKQYLEEFIVCSKSCFQAYKKTNGKAAFYQSASGDNWVANNFYQLYISLEKDWDVECESIDSHPNNCVVDMQELVEVKSNSNTSLLGNKNQANDVVVEPSLTVKKVDIGSLNVEYIFGNLVRARDLIWSNKDNGFLLVDFTRNLKEVITVVYQHESKYGVRSARFISVKTIADDEAINAGLRGMLKKQENEIVVVGTLDGKWSSTFFELGAALTAENILLISTEINNNLINAEQQKRIFADMITGIVINKETLVSQGLKTIFTSLSTESAQVLLKEFKTQLDKRENTILSKILNEYMNKKS